MHRVIVLDNLAQEGLDLLEQAENIQFEVRTGLKGDQLKEALLKYDGAILRSGAKITAATLAGNSHLKAIVRAGVGTDNIDKPAATRQGIVVMNTPTGNTISTAEHAFALMLALSRNVATAYQGLIEGRWDRKASMGAQLANKTLGIVGLGRIGLEVARRAQAFDMRVIGYDPFLSDEKAEALRIEPVSDVREMLPRIDYLTVHTPLTPETRDLIDAEAIDLIKPGARLINCARGGIYNLAALVAGLESGKISGVALDVYENEPCTDNPLFGKSGVVCTPHLGASTEEAQTQVAVEAVQLLLAYLDTGEIRHAVNVAPIDPKTLQSMRSYMNVAHRLGRFLSQWHEGNPSACRLTFRGAVAEKDTKLIQAAFCAGLLEEAVHDVNIINSEVLLHERGVKLIEESHTQRGAFTSSIDAEIVTDKGTFCAGGTAFGNEMPRLIRVGNYRLEAYLDGVLLLVSHNDVPGIIGMVGTVMGKHRVNIAQMAVGRAGESPGGRAVGVLNLDAEPDAAALEELLKHPDVDRADVITLPLAGQLPAWLEG